jgi:hypothetical protein
MASTDWTELTGSISAAALARGVTSGITVPNGGGSFTYGFNSIASGVTGMAGSFYSFDATFNPTAANKGGRITGAMKRMPSASNTDYAPFLFILAQGPNATDNSYMLGLQDDDPSHIVLVKGQMSAGLPAGDVGTSGILRKSAAAISVDTWIHLRIDAVVQGTGDVIITMKQNDLTTNTVTAPVWTDIDGMAPFTDDALGINSGSVPYTSGRFGFGMYSANVSRRAAFDQITIARQV